MGKLTEDEILEGLKSQNSEILAYLYSYFGPKILRYVLRNNGEIEEGQEVIHTTIIHLWQNVKKGSFKKQNKLDQYVMRIARNSWLLNLRNRGKHVSNIPFDEMELFLKDESDEEIIEKIVKDNRIELIVLQLKKLGDVCRKLIQQFYFENIQLKMIAEVENLKYGTIKKRLFDCKEKLRKLVVNAENQDKEHQ